MPYVGADGTIGGPKSIGRTITDFFAAIINFISLIFTSITNPPSRLESTGTYASRNNGRTVRPTGSTGGGRRPGSNIRGVKNLQGSCDAKMGGG